MSREPSISELAAMAAENEDQTETKVSGDYEKELIPEGPNFARFVEYIETGKHPQKPYQGKEKPPAEMLRLTFELLHPKKSIIEYEVDGVKKKRGQLITIQVKKSLSDKASFKKIFNAMVYGRDKIKHIAQMLGEPFLVNVYHNKSKDAAGKENVYANLNNSEGVYSIGAPRHTDPITQTVTDLAPHISQPFAPIRIFLWNNPTKTTWDSLFIDGTREVKDKDGTVTHESKNWLQEKIVSALNFEGSPLHTMLHGVSDLPVTETVVKKAAEPAADTGVMEDLPFVPDEPKGNGSAAAGKATSAAGMVNAGTAAPVVKKPSTPASVPANSANDALAALGLVA